jgi:hypothetical protein
MYLILLNMSIDIFYKYKKVNTTPSIVYIIQIRNPQNCHLIYTFVF